MLVPGVLLDLEGWTGPWDDVTAGQRGGQAVRPASRKQGHRVALALAPDGQASGHRRNCL